MVWSLNIVGLSFAFTALAIMLWSIARPRRRIWPPKNYGTMIKICVWVPTLSIFGAIIGLGVLGWNEADLPGWVRFGIGVPLIAIGHISVWREVAAFGIDQTGGATGTLRTTGLYRYSRNPQYVADIVMIIGWLLLSASYVAIPLGIVGILVLATAPLAEEPWLSERYGDEYDAYAARVRRYF